MIIVAARLKTKYWPSSAGAGSFSACSASGSVGGAGSSVADCVLQTRRPEAEPSRAELYAHAIGAPCATPRYLHRKGGGKRAPVTSSRTTLQNSRTLALTGAVSRPSTLKIRPASLGSRQAPKASPLARSISALVLCQIRSAVFFGVHRSTLPNTSNGPI